MPVFNEAPESQFAYVVVAGKRARQLCLARRHWWRIRARINPLAWLWKNSMPRNSNTKPPNRPPTPANPARRPRPKPQPGPRVEHIRVEDTGAGTGVPDDRPDGRGGRE